MPTVLTHALAGAAIAWATAPCRHLRTVTLLAAAAAILPDADVLGHSFGLDHETLLGHRGLTHSFMAAAVVAAAVALLFRQGPLAATGRWRIGICLFAAVASHGLLDALSEGGHGVAFFAPFDETRHYLPVSPLRTAPLRAAALFTPRGAAVLASEALWVWIPAALLIVGATLLRCRHSSPAPTAGQERVSFSPPERP